MQRAWYLNAISKSGYWIKENDVVIAPKAYVINQEKGWLNWSSQTYKSWWDNSHERVTWEIEQETQKYWVGV